MVEVHGYINSYLSGAKDAAAPVAPAVPAWPVAPAAVLAGIEARRMDWVPSLKHATGYNPQTDGVTLQTEIVGGGFDAAAYQAVVVSAVSHAPAQVAAAFRKARGEITGLEFSGRKVGTQALVKLGRFNVSPASLHIPIATPGVAEDWEIQGQGYRGDTLVGVPSDFKPVLVRG